MTATAIKPATLSLAVSREALRAGVAAVAPAVARASTFPVIKMLKLEASGGALTLTATNMDEWVEKTIAADVESEGTVLVSADTLSRLLKELPPEPIHLGLKGDRLTVRCGKVRGSLATLPPDEYPSMHGDGQATVCTLGVGALRKLAERTAFAVSQADSRPILQGVLLEMRADRLRMVATDGAKMARADEVVSGTDAGDVIVSPAVFEHMARCFADTDNVELARGERWVSFRTDTAQVTTRLIEGPYPNYDQVIPKQHKVTAVVDRLALLATVQRVLVVVDGTVFSDGTKHRRVRLLFDNGVVQASGSDQDVGALDDSVPCELTGAPIELACNGHYLAEILRRLPGDQVVFRMTTPTRVIAIEPTLPAADYLCLLMGMRLE